MLQECRYAWRSLLKSRGFTTAALLTLSLSIGANAVVFSFVNGLVLRPLPFGEATSRIVSLHGTHPTQFPDNWDDAGVSFPDLEDIARESELLEDVGGYFERSFTLELDEAIPVRGGSVTPSLFSMLNVAPAHGRGFRSDEGQAPGFETVVILSHGLWQNRFGGDPDILGRPIRINERELTVVGIMPPRFRFPERDDLWVPFRPQGEPRRAARYLLAVAKLKEDASLEQARRELEAIAERLAARYPDTNRGWGLYVLPFRDYFVGRGERLVASMLLGAVGLVLLLGCANLASLLLVRGSERQRELAVRAAMGAGRMSLVRQMLVESLMLGVAGGALGTLLALWGRDALVASFPEELPYWLRVDLDWRVITFVGIVSLAASVLFGLLPALSVSRFRLASAIGTSREPSSYRGSLRAQSALVIGQVALSLALLVGASLMFQSFLSLYNADPGFDGKSVLTLRVLLSGDEYDPPAAKVGYFRDALDRIRAVSGIEAAAATSSIPTDDGGGAARIVTREHPIVDGSETGVQLVSIMPGFFETLDLALEGRDFAPRDLEAGAAPVAIVNRSLAERLPRQTSEIGLVTEEGIEWLRVVGIAPDIQYEEFSEETAQSRLNVYVPYSRSLLRGMAFLVRTASDPAERAASVRQTLREFRPGVPVFLVRSMDEVRYMTTWEQRLFSQLFVAFAGSALLLACLGIYGLNAYRAGRRTHEIGIRMALGASRADVQRLLFGQGFALVTTGIAIGLVLSLAVSRLIESALYNVVAFNVPLYAGAAGLLALAVLSANYLPARRAARVPPMAALRLE